MSETKSEAVFHTAIDPHHVNARWTAEKIAQVRAMAAIKGTTSGHIAGVFGVTRNVIIGVCRRNGIQLTGTSIFRKAAGGRRRMATAPARQTAPDNAPRALSIAAVKPRFSILSIDAPQAPGEECPPSRDMLALLSISQPALDARPPEERTGTAAAIMALREFALGAPNHCRWPQGESGAGFRFCSAITAPGESYCALHFEQAINPSARTEMKYGVRRGV